MTKIQFEQLTDEPSAPFHIDELIRALDTKIVAEDIIAHVPRTPLELQIVQYRLLTTTPQTLTEMSELTGLEKGEIRRTEAFLLRKMRHYATKFRGEY